MVGVKQVRGGVYVRGGEKLVSNGGFDLEALNFCVYCYLMLIVQPI